MAWGPDMVDVFISYSRKDLEAVSQLARQIEAEGYEVWWDAELPPHKSYGEVITAKIEDANAAIVVWSPDAAQSEWVRAEADMARNAKKLIQTALGDILPPLPFNQIQFADIGAWQGEDDHIGWRKIKESLRDLCGEREKPASGVTGQVASATASSAPASAASRTEPAPQAASHAGSQPGTAAPTSDQPKAKTPVWPIFAGLGVAALGVLGAGAFVVSSALDQPLDEEDSSPLALLEEDLERGTNGADSVIEQDKPIDVPPPAPGTSELGSGGQTTAPAPSGPSYSNAPQNFTGSLYSGQTSNHYVGLNGNVSYTLAAECDQDCSDIDMKVYDENGILVGEDVLEDAIPIVDVTPIRSAQFRVELIMYDCSVEPCGYQVVTVAN